MKRAICLVLGLLACEPASAADGAATVEALKERALQVVIAADLARREQSCPSPGRADLYFGGIEDGRAFRLSLGIDGAAPVERGFSSAEARALADGGLFHFDCFDLSTGTHHLQAALNWTADQGGEAPPPLRLEQDFAAPEPGALLELRLHRGLFGTSLELTERSGKPYRPDRGWRARLDLALPEESAGQFVLGGAGDPRVRQAHFLLESGRAMSASAVLRKLAVEAQDTALAPRFPLELAQAELAFGISAEAEAQWRAAPQVAATRAQRAALGLDLAQYRYERCDLSPALDLLGAPQASHGPQPDPALTARQGLYSMLLLAEGRQEQAAEVLRDTFNAADYESWVRYYNLGVSLVRSGRITEGLTALNRVGSLAGGSPRIRYLRDHANLVLARYFLEAGQGATAIPVFGRIDSTGQESASALLGLGWAWLAPAGTPQPETQLGDEIVIGAPPETLDGAVADRNDQILYQRFHVAPFDQARVPSDQAERLRRALVSWVVVADRSERDERSEEAKIDIAWALRRLGAAEEAAQYDEQAVAALAHEYSLLDAAEAQARDGQGPDRWLAADTAVEPGLPWDLPALPPAPGRLYLLDLVASNPFQVALHDYRDLRLLQSGLGDAGDAVLRKDLQDALRTQRLLLRDLQLAALAVQRHRVDSMLLQARTALTQAYDNPDAELQQLR